jgi:transcriptional regulator with XRE-family HTH domain
MIDPELHLNTRKLKELRISRGYSRSELAQQTGIAPETLRKIEQGESVISVPNFRKVCLELNLDPLDVMELLRLKPISFTLLFRFRAACKQEGTTPLQALTDFMEVYVHD